MNDQPQYQEGDYSPDQQYRLHNGGWIPAAQYPEAWPPIEPPTPWYKQRAVLGVGLVVAVLALLGIGVAFAGNGSDEALQDDFAPATEDATDDYEGGSAWERKEPTVTEPPVDEDGDFDFEKAQEQDQELLEDTAWRVLVREMPQAEILGRAVMEDFADVACTSFARGTSFEEAGLLGLEAGFEPDEVGSMLGYAIFGHCPEHADLLD